MPEQERGGEGASESTIAMVRSVPEAVGDNEWPGEEGTVSRVVSSGGRVDGDG